MSGGGIFERLRAALGVEPTTVGGKRLVSRIEAAEVCVRVLAKLRVAGLVHAPRREAGRVAVVMALISPQQRVRVGWIDIPLTGELLVSFDDSSIAAAIAPSIRQAIMTAFAGLAVRPVKPDARTWLIGDRRIAQAASGQWTVTSLQGAVLAIVESPEDAMRAAQTRQADSAPAEPSPAAEMLVEMERDHAARWVAKQLRAHGYETRVEQDSITLALHGFAARMRIGATGIEFDANVPALARSVAEAALRRVEVVDHLEEPRWQST